MFTKISTKKAPAAIGPYSQAILLNDFLFVSGQLPIEPDTSNIASTIEEQTRQVMKNLKAILKEAKMTTDNVIKTTCFLANMEDFSVFNQIYSETFTNCPARSCVAVKELPKGVLCEIEVIAHI